MNNDGIILIDKPIGMTSFGVVARVRRVLSEKVGKKVKVGHCGTLDPFATGLLILVTGKECRNAMTYTKLDKVYEATFILGRISTTGDPEGEISKKSDKVPTDNEIASVVQKFIGDIEQRPPIYSAIKVGGKRAYKLARDGKSVEIPSRIIHIYDISVINYEYPRVSIRTHVGSGTYIRSLAEDIGKELGTGAFCETLRRISIADWQVDKAKKLSDLGIVD